MHHSKYREVAEILLDASSEPQNKDMRNDIVQTSTVYMLMALYDLINEMRIDGYSKT